MDRFVDVKDEGVTARMAQTVSGGGVVEDVAVDEGDVRFRADEGLGRDVHTDAVVVEADHGLVGVDGGVVIGVWPDDAVVDDCARGILLLAAD